MARPMFAFSYIHETVSTQKNSNKKWNSIKNTVTFRVPIMCKMKLSSKPSFNDLTNH